MLLLLKGVLVTDLDPKRFGTSKPAQSFFRSMRLYIHEFLHSILILIYHKLALYVRIQKLLIYRYNVSENGIQGFNFSIFLLR